MRRRLFRAFLAFLCCAALASSSGCYGKSPTTSAIVKWHHGLEMDKYSKEAVYLPVFFLALPIAALVDNFIINAIAYWSHDDPLQAANASDSDDSEEPQIAGDDREPAPPAGTEVAAGLPRS